MSLPSLSCSGHKPPSGVIHSSCGCSIYTWHSCVPPQNHTFLHILRLSADLSDPQWTLSLLSGEKLFQAWGSVLNSYLVFTCANLSFHVCSWKVSYLADNSVAKLPLCAKECEDKVSFGHGVGKAGQSGLGFGVRVGRSVWKKHWRENRALGDCNLSPLRGKVWFPGDHSLRNWMTVSPADLNCFFPNTSITASWS